jgi:hypothetical protein
MEHTMTESQEIENAFNSALLRIKESFPGEYEKYITEVDSLEKEYKLELDSCLLEKIL